MFLLRKNSFELDFEIVDIKSIKLYNKKYL